MSFDPITLALAKNYTDKKVAEGGGSGGGAGSGLPVVDFDTELTIGDGSPINLGENDAQRLQEIFDSGAAAFIGRFMLDGEAAAGVFIDNPTGVADVKMYIGTANTLMGVYHTIIGKMGSEIVAQITAVVAM